MSEYKKIIRDFLSSGREFPINVDEIATWAIENKRYGLKDATILRACKRAIAEYLRGETVPDSKGRRVRANHPAWYTVEGKQMMLWHNIDLAPREHMEKSLDFRRKHIHGECKQAKIDIDYYNETRPEEPPLQMSFDFTSDLEEAELAESSNLEEIAEKWNLTSILPTSKPKKTKTPQRTKHTQPTSGNNLQTGEEQRPLV